MWKVPITLAGFGTINYPSVCPLSPKCGHAFCEEHCRKASLLGYPTELKPFLNECGLSSGNLDEGLFGWLLNFLNMIRFACLHGLEFAV